MHQHYYRSTGFVVAIAAFAVMTAGTGRALESTSAWMDEAALSATFKDKSVDGEYASGRKFKEVYRGDGGLRYHDDMRDSGGHWSISSGTFCTIYDDDPAGGCFRVQKSGPNCFDFYFVARTEDKAPGPPGHDPSWTARAWFSDQETTCKQRVGV